MTGDYRQELEEAARDAVVAHALPVDLDQIPSMSDTTLSTLLDLRVSPDGTLYSVEDRSFELPVDPDAIRRFFGMSDKPRDPEPEDWRGRLDRLDRWDAQGATPSSDD